MYLRTKNLVLFVPGKFVLAVATAILILAKGLLS